MSGQPTGERAAPRILILGIGNLLMGDEGFGPHLVQRLDRMGVPDGVVLEDGGVGGVDLLHRLQEFDRVLLIDALRFAMPAEERVEDRASSRDRGSGATAGPAAGAASPARPVPGEVVVFRLNRVELLNPDPQVSLHGCSLGGLLRLAEALRFDLPEITVLGLVPARIEWTDRLSDEAERAMPCAEACARQWIAESLSMA